MTTTELPDDLRRFILTSIPSVPYLEAVLLMRTSPQQAWTGAELARRLYVPEAQGAQLVQMLAESAIAGAGAEPGTIRYIPAPELAGLLDRLAEAYARDLVTVTELIHSRIDRRAQRFADAFRFRKE